MLIFSSTVVLAQGRLNRSCRLNIDGNGSGICLSVLTDLSEMQKSKIAELVESHQEAMDELRVQRRADFEQTQKNTIREEMLQEVQSHRNEVRNLLTVDQQKQFDLIHSGYGYTGSRYSDVNAGNRWQKNTGRRGGRGRW